MHEMEQLNRIDATAFYDRYYAPNNAILVVAGDVEPGEVRALAEKTYGALAAGPALPPRTRPQEPEQNTKRIVELADPRVNLPSFQSHWIVPSYTTSRNGEAEALDLLSEILGGGLRSRIYQTLVVEKGIASSAGASYSGTSLDETSFSVFGVPRGDATLEEVEKAVGEEIAAIVRDGVSEAELEKARTRFLRSVIFARDNQAGMANMYGATLATGGTVADIAEWPDRIRSVSPAQVQAVAAKYLDLRRSVTGYLLPQPTAQN